MDCMDFFKGSRKLWEHPDVKSTQMWAFMQEANRRHGLKLETFDDLYEWSCKERAQFYEQLWLAQRTIHQGSLKRVVDESVPVTQVPRWFEGIEMNWTENMLWNRAPGQHDTGLRSTVGKEDDKTAVVEICEGNIGVNHVTWGQLRKRTAELARAMHRRGVGEGDVVAAVARNSSDTLVVYLAAGWLGAVFSSCSVDMGVEGLLMRMEQMKPKFIFFDHSGQYNGRWLDAWDKIEATVQAMIKHSEFQGAVVMGPRCPRAMEEPKVAKTEWLGDFLRQGLLHGGGIPDMCRVAFDAPLVLSFSSGTTGPPKGVAHSVGGMLINMFKEFRLHTDQASAVVLQYTTTAWITWPATMGFLAVGAKRIVLYDGSPMVPDVAVLLRVVEQQRVTALGINPRWLGMLKRAGVVPQRVADLSRLRVVTSTGLILSDALFEWFYDVAFAKHVQLCNVSGGTEIAGSCLASNPLKALHVGGFMGPSLGIAMSVYDQDAPRGAHGHRVHPGKAGELVFTAPFPNLPRYLVGDSQPAPGRRYREAYFARFQGVWTCGDLCAVQSPSGRAVVLGRSDGVIKVDRGSVGSADIYDAVERRLADVVVDSLCVGRRQPGQAEEQVLLFVVLRAGEELNGDELVGGELVGGKLVGGEVIGQLAQRIRQAIHSHLTEMHVPAHVFAAPAIPMTMTGKKVETLVKKIIEGDSVAQPRASLINPGSLDYFYRFRELHGA